MNIELGNHLAELRKKHGYSQEDLADKLDISRQAISKWENGESDPSTENLIALSKLYGVSLDELVGNVKPVENDDEPIVPEVIDPEHEDDGDKGGLRMSRIQKFISGFGALIALIAYLILGFVWKGNSGALGWKVGWISFLIPIVLTSIFAAIESHKASYVAVAPLAVAIYVGMGIIGIDYGINLWHPYWIIFLFIPLYQVITGYLESKRSK